MPNVFDYFERACRREPQPLRGMAGETCVDPDGASAVFSLEVTGDHIVKAAYKCTTCCTLVGLCEHAAEMLSGMRTDEAARWTAATLLARHPEIPPMRQDRASLAARAVASAANRARMEIHV